MLVLPFQLYDALKWVTIPGSIGILLFFFPSPAYINISNYLLLSYSQRLIPKTVAAYIILGLATIGSEIENPFGHDVNDLPLDTYCRQIALELDIITAMPPPRVDDFATRDENLVLYPLSTAGFPDWKNRSVDEIRAALRTKVVANTDITTKSTANSNGSGPLVGTSSDAETVVGSLRSKQSV